MPLPGQSIDIVSDDTTEVAVQFDPNRDITVDGKGGDYGQPGGPNNPPGASCGPGGPCGKPFNLASDYGVTVRVEAAPPAVFTDRVVVEFKPGVDRATVDSINASIGASVIDFSRFSNYYLLHLPPTESLNDAVKFYSGKSEVAFALPDTAVSFAAPPPPVTPCNQDYKDPGPLSQINAPEAWSRTQGSRQSDAPLIAVIDTGFDLAHSGLLNNWYINQDELLGVPFLDADGDGQVTLDDFKQFDINGDNQITFVDLNAEANDCLCMGNAPWSQRKDPNFCNKVKTCDVDGDGMVTPYDLVNGDCGCTTDADGGTNCTGECTADTRISQFPSRGLSVGFQNGVDDGTNGRKDDLVGWNFYVHNNLPSVSFGSANGTAPH
jgi:hypothetical protein